MVPGIELGGDGSAALLADFSDGGQECDELLVFNDCLLKIDFRRQWERFCPIRHGVRLKLLTGLLGASEGAVVLLTAEAGSGPRRSVFG